MYISVFQIFGQSELQYLRRAFLSSQADIQKLATENAALKQQMASKEQSWENERKKLLSEHRRILAEDVLQTSTELDKVVEELKLKRELYELRCEMSRQVQEKEDEVRSIKQELLDKTKDQEEDLRRENEKVSKSCEDKVTELKTTYDQQVSDLNTEWQRRLLEKENVITDLEVKAKEVSEENFHLKKKVEVMEAFLTRLEKWKTKCQDQQNDHYRVEEQLHLKVEQLEEKIELLTKENTDLEVCHVS